MRNGTLPKPEPMEVPIYLDSELYGVFFMLFGLFTGLAVCGFIFIDGGHLNDCTNLKAPDNWTQLCFKLNNNVVTLFAVLGTITSVSLIMYFVSKSYVNKRNGVSSEQ